MTKLQAWGIACILASMFIVIANNLEGLFDGVAWGMAIGGFLIVSAEAGK